MRKIRFPHDVVHADHVAQLDAGALVPEIDVDLALEELARPRHDALRPQVAALPFVIAGFEHVVHPADAGLGAHPAQAREAIEHAREDEIGDELRLGREPAGRSHRLSLIGREALPARNS